MGLLELLSGLEDHKRVTLLANEYVILEHKQEQCVGRYKVFDFNGVELIIKATLNTPQEVMSVDTLRLKLKDLNIDNSPNACPPLSCSGAIASGLFSFAIGNSNTASGESSVAMGEGTSASGDVAVAMGYYANSSGYGSIAIGHSTEAYDIGSIALGAETQAFGQSAIAMGSGTVASGYYSTAMGYETSAVGWCSTALGSYISVNQDNTLGNRGPIYGEELYSKQFDGSGIVGTKGGDDYRDLDHLRIMYSKTNINNYTISAEMSRLSNSKRYFNTTMIQDCSTSVRSKNPPSSCSARTAVNITQLVYTLVGAVKQLKELTENQQKTIQGLKSRLDILEST